MKLRNRVDYFLFGEYAASPTNLALYRILYAICILAIYLPQHLWISNFPQSFFDPPVGLGLLFSEFPGAVVLGVLNGLLILAAFSLLVGYRTPLASASVGLLLLLGNVWAYSFGKINNDVLMILVPLLLAFSGWGDVYSADSQLEPPVHFSQNAWPLALLALLIGLAMMTAAEPKFASGWLDLHTHAVRGHLLRNLIVVGRSGGLGAAMLRIKSGIFWEALDYGTVLLEASFLLAVFRRRTFRMVCAVACFFHLGIALTMQIAYWPNILAYAAFCDWPPVEPAGWIDQLLKLMGRFRAPQVLLGGATISAVYLTLGNPVKILATQFHPESDTVLGLIVCLVAAGVSAVFLPPQIRMEMTRLSRLFASTFDKARPLERSA